MIKLKEQNFASIHDSKMSGDAKITKSIYETVWIVSAVSQSLKYSSKVASAQENKFATICNIGKGRKERDR